MPIPRPFVRKFGWADFNSMTPLDDSQNDDIFITRRGALGSNRTVTRSQILSSDPYILIRDEKASGTDGGTFTFGVYQTRDLNTIVVDTGSNVVALAANQIELTAGTYRFKARAPCFSSGLHKTKLRDVTDAVDISIGSNANDGFVIQTNSVVSGRFIIAAAKNLELQHRCQITTEIDGFGVATSFGDIEVYAEIEFWKEQ